MMAEEYKIISGAIDLWDYEESERIRKALDITRSEFIRRAVRLFNSVHDFKSYNAKVKPVPKSVIADADARTVGAPYDETSTGGENRPRPTPKAVGRVLGALGERGPTER